MIPGLPLSLHPTREMEYASAGRSGMRALP
jgi:hypothetical protein